MTGYKLSSRAKFYGSLPLGEDILQVWYPNRDLILISPTDNISNSETPTYVLERR